MLRWRPRGRGRPTGSRGFPFQRRETPVPSDREGSGLPELPGVRRLPAGERFGLDFNVPAFFFGPIHLLVEGLWRQAVVQLFSAIAMVISVGPMGPGRLDRGVGPRPRRRLRDAGERRLRPQDDPGDAPWFRRRFCRRAAICCRSIVGESGPLGTAAALQGMPQVDMFGCPAMDCGRRSGSAKQRFPRIGGRRSRREPRRSRASIPAAARRHRPVVRAAGASERGRRVRQASPGTRPG
ncbi:DUF2628 domain-containing protein [Luteimonas deserti]|uniref:DUF2628 domain-containing protein n=1 Tax=Luteimonas deserti TaxID=2752306 RepID=UPI001F19B10D|nr:DUF2628 domain-containing protein [Luteimonas deserti]